MSVRTFSRNAFLCSAVFLVTLAAHGAARSLQERIDELAAKGGGTLVLKPGVYETGAIFFKPGVNLHLERGATIIGVDDAEGYPMRETRIEGETCVYYPALVNADGCDGFTISGEGVIDGHGLPTWKAFWELRKSKPRMLNKDPSLVRPRLLYVSNSKNVDVSGVTFKNSKFWTTHFYRCENVRVHDCEIVAEVIDGVRGPSTDAIDIDVCRNFFVSNVVMDVNDDAVVVKGGKGLEANDYVKFPWNGPSDGVVVEDCLFKSVCHSCLTLGSECPAVTNVVMRNCRLDGPGNLVNVKMRDDTPQDFSGVLVENCRGKCRKLFNCREWKQFSKVKAGEEPPTSRLSDFTMRGNTVVAKERSDSFRDRSFIKFSNCRFEDGTPPFSWPAPTQTMKPWVYNWWMGSAVDENGLESQCRDLAEKCFGGFHVIPIYGAKGGYEKNWKSLLSPQWIEAWNSAARKAEKHGLGIDLTMGSGWCFGGPWIDKDHAASSGMKVKRAGLGGTGYMIDPFDPEAMKFHVAAFDKWFGKEGSAARPRAFYHDSYEYYGAEPKNGQDVDEAQLECFRVWTDWCRDNGYMTRNEAHGAPSNWLDFYALADIPETEMFGKNDRDILISKFASSAAHAKGATLVSAESCTWIDEHFCERPAEIKAFVDRLFLAGVNHVFYHGCCYSPVDAVWPGWCFYASLEMNPRNPIWREMGALNAYVTRCQSIFQTWTPDNDLAVLWDPAPYRAKHPGKTMNMTVHGRDWFYGERIGKVAKELYMAGYAFDYVSPRMVKAGLAKKYVELVDPERFEFPSRARRMPFDAASGLLATRWRKDGETGYFVVNTGGVARVVVADAEFTVADPLGGAIAMAKSAELKPRHSLFVIGDGFVVGGIVDAALPDADGRAVSMKPPHSNTAIIPGPWCVEPICGGPAMPSARTLNALVGWETFDDAFSGTMLYKTTFNTAGASVLALPCRLSLGDVREIARVRLNGRDLGVKFMAPYDFAIPDGLLKPEGNVLEVEVTNLGANRLRWNDLNGVRWKYFSDINMVGMDYKPLDASKWKPLKSGLLGPVELLTP